MKKNGGKVLKDYNQREFDAIKSDQINIDSDETLTKYIPAPLLIRILTHRTHITLE